MIESFKGNIKGIAGTMKEAADLVYNIANLDKPVIAAINGVAVGAGLAVALMADISIMSETARITDGHVRLGVGAGYSPADLQAFAVPPDTRARGCARACC